jgi:hypothetical protein
LQFAAAKLWEQRDKQRKTLTHASYAGMGGVAGALASHADRIIADIGQQKSALVRAILLRLVTPERTRAVVPMTELRELSREVGEVQRLVDHMVDARLLVVQTLEGGKGSTVEIVHESLVQGWPTLRRWLDENQDDAALVDQLRIAARQWQQKNRDAGLLWRGETADEAKKFRKRYKGPLSDVERGFLDAVVAHEQAAIRRKRMGVIGGFIVLSGLVVAAIVIALYFQNAHKEMTDLRNQAEASDAETKKQFEAFKIEQEQRREAEEKAAAARKQTTVVTGQLDVAQEDLKETNKQLTFALEQAQDNAEKAEKARNRAELGEARAEALQKEAEKAKNEAIVAQKEAERLQKIAEDRAKRMEKQLGTKIVPTLK